ncbi:MAG: DNA polymerase III subunit beta [Ahrensia sp.]|nr:DNA polymerase III subunit beta [Ahrensia sp.]
MSTMSTPWFKIKKSILLPALERANGVIETRNTVPILGNIKIVTEKDSVILTATDLDIQISEKVYMISGGDKDDGLTLPFAQLFAFVRRLPDSSDILFDINPQNAAVKVSSGRAHLTLGSLPVSDYPVFSQKTMRTTLTAKAATLLSCLQRAAVAISNEETRYYLNGVFMHLVEGDLVMVSTDGHKLARVRLNEDQFEIDQRVETDGNGEASAQGIGLNIVPTKTVKMLMKALAKNDQNVSIDFSESHIRMSYSEHDGAFEIVSKLIDGTFPDYARVIPQPAPSDGVV